MGREDSHFRREQRDRQGTTERVRPTVAAAGCSSIEGITPVRQDRPDLVRAYSLFGKSPGRCLPGSVTVRAVQKNHPPLLVQKRSLVVVTPGLTLHGP